MIIYQILYVVIFFFLVYVYTKKKWASLVFLYILLVPMGQTLPDNAIIIPGIGIVDFITILLILKYFQVYKKITKYPSKLHRLAVFLSFFFIVIYLATFYIKHYNIYGLGGVSFWVLTIRLSKLVAWFLSIFLIIIKSNDSEVFKSIKNGLIYGLLFYSISVYFSEFFIVDLGLNVSKEVDIKKFEYLEAWQRRDVGLFAGDSNYLSHYLAVGFGFSIAVYEKSRKNKYIGMMIILLSAIIFTASRTGLITISAILFLFSVINFRKKIQNVILLVVISFALFYFTGSYLIDRIYGLNVEFSNTIGEGRLSYQLYYVQEILENPIYLIVGYTEKSTLYRWRVPHNQYLGMVFWGGLIYLIIFWGLIINILRKNKRLANSKKTISILYPTVGFIIPYMFNPNEYITYFPLISNELLVTTVLESGLFIIFSTLVLKLKLTPFSFKSS